MRIFGENFKFDVIFSQENKTDFWIEIEYDDCVRNCSKLKNGKFFVQFDRDDRKDNNETSKNKRVP